MRHIFGVGCATYNLKILKCASQNNSHMIKMIILGYMWYLVYDSYNI